MASNKRGRRSRRRHLLLGCTTDFISSSSSLGHTRTHTHTVAGITERNKLCLHTFNSFIVALAARTSREQGRSMQRAEGRDRGRAGQRAEGITYHCYYIQLPGLGKYLLCAWPPSPTLDSHLSLISVSLDVSMTKPGNNLFMFRIPPRLPPPAHSLPA